MGRRTDGRLRDTYAERGRWRSDGKTIRCVPRVLSARFLCGDGEFYHEFSDTIRRELLPDVEKSSSPCNSRPCVSATCAMANPPTSCSRTSKRVWGELRDYHSAFWVARAAQPTTRDLEDFLHFGLLTEVEMKEYREALDFVWRVRNELHLRSGRAKRPDELRTPGADRGNAGVRLRGPGWPSNSRSSDSWAPTTDMCATSRAIPTS